MLGPAVNYLQPESIIELELYEGSIVNVALPEFMELKITSAPAPKKESGVTTFKEATLENGVTVLVPQFIKEGDRVRIDWAHNKYVDRVKEDKKV